MEAIPYTNFSLFPLPSVKIHHNNDLPEYFLLFSLILPV